jgi:ABC-2 type transport system ATP-binding protein
MAHEIVARFDRATKRFGPGVAVQDLSFTVPAGRIVGLLGRNGAGKTTSLRMLLGLTAPTSGAATVFGRPYARLPHARRRVGVVLETVGPLPGVGARRELRIWARMLGLSHRRVDDVLDLVGLTGSAPTQAITTFSAGMRRRYGLAVALLAEPELLVLDEPTNGLDPEGILWLRELLRSLAREGRTILLSSHLLAEVQQVVDDVVILERTVQFQGPLGALTDSGRIGLEEAFFALTQDGPVPTGTGSVRRG